jgi:hypothetical protein
MWGEHPVQEKSKAGTRAATATWVIGALTRKLKPERAKRVDSPSVV